MKMYRMWLDRWRGVFDPCFVFIPLVPLEEGWLPLMWDMMSKKLPMTRHYDGIKLKLPLTKVLLQPTNSHEWGLPHKEYICSGVSLAQPAGTGPNMELTSHSS
ncbi:hypothetical protein VPH35_001140 [Triticum aestivum]